MLDHLTHRLRPLGAAVKNLPQNAFPEIGRDDVAHTLEPNSWGMRRRLVLMMMLLSWEWSDLV